MNTTLKLLSATAVLAIALGGNVQAQSLSHIDRMAQQLQSELRVVHQEVHEHFRPFPPYADLDRDITAMEQRAAHLRELIHRGGSLRHLRADVQDLDRLLHHIEELVDSLARFREIDRRAYAHLRQSLDRVSRTLHHLSDDLDGGHGHSHHPF